MKLCRLLINWIHVYTIFMKTSKNVSISVKKISTNTKEERKQLFIVHSTENFGLLTIEPFLKVFLLSCYPACS